MKELIDRHDALNFDTAIEADPDDIPMISEGMALYGEYIKGLPVVKIGEGGTGMFFIGLFIGSVVTAAWLALLRAGRGD